MNIILERMKVFMAEALEGRTSLSDEVCEEFGARCTKMLKKAFSEPPSAYEPYLSSIGKPVCQQWMEKNRAKERKDPYSLKLKFLMGDMLEAVVIAIIKGSGTKVEGFQESVEMDLGYKDPVRGRLDAVIDGKVYDIKSASPYAFSNKYNHSDGFQRMAEDDAFGYLPQAYLYSAAKGLPFGGWIAINKVTGDLCILEPPRVDRSYSKAALKKAQDNATELQADKPFKACFEAVDELWYKKPTGNKVLCINCEYCGFKETCPAWEGKISFVSSPSSKAKNPKKKWYVGAVK